MARAITQRPGDAPVPQRRLTTASGAINENYARELMELFTLGADRGAYTETDVRELARALTGWDADWSDGELGVHELPLGRADRWDPGYKTVFGKTGALDVGGRRAHGRRAPEAPVVLRREAVELLRPDRAGRRHVAAKLERALRRAPATQIRPVLEAILCSPQLYDGPADGQAAGRASSPGMLRARERGDHRRARGPGCSPAAASVLYYPPDVSGWDDKRWLDTNTIARALGRWSTMALERHTDRPGRGRYPAETADRGARRRPRASGARRRSTDAAAWPRSTRSPATTRSPPTPRDWQRAPAPERPAPADRRLPRLPDLLRTAMACHCNDFSRSAPQAGRGLRGDRAGHARARRHRPLPPRVPRARQRARAVGLRRRRCCRAMALEEGIARAAAGPAEPVLVSIFLVRRVRLAVDAGAGRRPALRDAAPHARRSPARPGVDAFSEDPTPALAPDAAPLRDLHAAGKVSVMPAIGYDDPNQSHFTSRHYWEVGELNPVGRDRLARPLPRPPRRRRQPAAGPLARLHAGAGAGGRSNVPVAAVAAPESYASGRRDVWDDARRTKLIDALGALGRARRPPTRSSRPRAPRGDRRRVGAARPARPASQGIDAAVAAAVGYPSTDGFARRLAALAEMLDTGLPLRCVALDANGGYDTHDNQAGDAARRPRRCPRSRWPPSRPTSRRAASPTACSINVWSEFGRRPEENGSGTDHGAGGALAAHRHARQGHDGRRVPRPRRRSTSDDNLAPHGRLPRASTARCSSSGSASTPAGIVPGASGFARPALVR